MTLRALAVSALSLISFHLALSQDLPKTEIPFERLYQYPIINGRSPTAPAMSPDGKQIVFGWNQTGLRRLDVWMMDFPSGTKKQILDSSKFEDLPRQDDTRTEQEKKEAVLYDAGISGFAWAPDSSEFTFSYKGRAWRLKRDGSGLAALFDANEGVGSVQYSPDGQYISYLKGGNVYRMSRREGGIKQLTFISKPGTAIDGYYWSPDSKWIAVQWSDNSKMGHHQIMDFSKDRATVVNISRMWDGEQSQNSKVGLIPADGGLIKWVEDIPAYNWLNDFAWAPDSSKFAVGWDSADFKQYTISVVPTDSIKKFDAYHEVAPKNYIPDFRQILWTRDSKKILFTTDIFGSVFGFRSVMSVEPNGLGLTKVFAENYDVVAMQRPKDSDRLVLVTMARSPLMTEITVVEPDGKRTVHTPVQNGFATGKQFDACDAPLVSDDGKCMASLPSTREMNPELYAIEPKEARLTESQLPEFKTIKWAEMKEITFKAPDGATIHGVLIQKPGLDKKKMHPAFISNMYANSAKMNWNGYFENWAAMNLDMVVLQVDFRASWGLGGEFNSGYYHAMGIIDADESVAAKDYLVSLGYVNPKRVGCWGWSYGGFLTCMNLLTKPGVFDTGVAVAPVTDWAAYNEWYTRRRLGLPDENKDLYKQTSPMYHADGLQDNFLIVHGIMDDNVLFQDTARLIEQLIEHGKYFSEMTYPRDDHSIGKIDSRPHVFGTIMRFLNAKLNRP